MSRRIERGCVVVRAGQFAVVWAIRGDMLELFPVIRADLHMAGDVLLDLADMVAMSVPVRDAVIRVAASYPASTSAQTVVGEVPSARICELVRSVVRIANDRAMLTRWSGDRAHRHNAAAPPVRMVGA